MGNGSSYKLAALIAGAVILYFVVRTVLGGVFGSTEQAETEDAATPVFTVKVTQVEPQSWQENLAVRGRTKAIRKVTVRAETSGLVAATPTKIGAQVKEGDILCRLQVDARQAQRDQARAALSKAKIDYNAARTLKDEGFSSDTAVASAKAAFDLATANLKQAQTGLEQSVIRAPFDGVFDERLVEAGDLLRPGDPCGIVIQQTPYLVVGAISERNVGKISLGDRGVARLATGETVEGTVRYVAQAADPATRTFDLELEIPNTDGKLRDGVTAQFSITASRRSAHVIKRAALVLNDEGAIGVRTVEDGVVVFKPVTPLGDNANGFWVTGLEGVIALITRGQEFVVDGQTVDVAVNTDADEPGAGTRADASASSAAVSGGLGQ
ncbi:MAG: efflux RND transporter periplasmic adaptor subunit [Pseudomonadota bacterium]